MIHHHHYAPPPPPPYYPHQAYQHPRPPKTWQPQFNQVVPCLICCWPVGLIMLIGNRDIPARVKWWTCGVLFVLVVVAMVIGAVNQPPPSRR